MPEFFRLTLIQDATNLCGRKGVCDVWRLFVDLHYHRILHHAVHADAWRVSVEGVHGIGCADDCELSAVSEIQPEKAPLLNRDSAVFPVFSSKLVEVPVLIPG
jgi:hypothetical protein